MKTRVNKSGLQVDALLAQFIDTEAIVGTGVDSTTFWILGQKFINIFCWF